MVGLETKEGAGNGFTKRPLMLFLVYGLVALQLFLAAFLPSELDELLLAIPLVLSVIQVYLGTKGVLWETWTGRVLHLPAILFGFWVLLKLFDYAYR